MRNILLITGILCLIVIYSSAFNASGGNQTITTTANEKKIISLIPGGISSIQHNASSDNSLSTKTWVGAGSGGVGTDFNTSTNWSPSGVPGTFDDCVMNITSSTTITLSASITVNSLSITYNTSASGNQTWTLDVKDNALTVNGNVSAVNNTPAGTNTRNLQIRVGATSGVNTGAIIVGGNASFGLTGTRPVVLIGATGSLSRFEFQGDVTFGTQSVTNITPYPYRYVFNKATGTQTLTVNSTSILFSAVEVGNQSTNTPTLTLAGSSNAQLSSSASRKYLAVYSGSTLDMSTKTLNMNTGTSDTLYLDNNATIKVGGTTGGLTGSNFPSGFAGYKIYSNSTINYNSTSGAQTQSLIGTVYNITIDNSSGVTLGGASTINNTLTLTNGTYTNGANLTFAAGATINRYTGILSSVPTFGTSVNVTYSGTTGVTVGNELPTTATILNNLTINNSGGVTASAAYTVNGTLTFVSGNLITGANVITLGASASVTGESNTSYLIGKLSATRTVGTGSSSFSGMGMTINSGVDNIGVVTLLRSTGTVGTVTVNGLAGISRCWNVTTAANPNTGGRTITFSWLSADDNGKDMTQAQVWRKIAAGDYEQLSTIQNVSASDPRSMTSTNTTGLNGSTWTISDPVHPLPVEMLSFDASTNGRDATLNWVTAFEINNKGFNIERRAYGKNSYDEWKTINFISGYGTTNEYKFYSYQDKNLSTAKYQYRLKQIDFNGSSEYFMLNNPSEVVIGKPVYFGVSQNYPNPSNPNSKIDYQIPSDGLVSLKIYDMLGQEVADLVNEFRQAGFYTAIFNGNNLSSGIYFYRLTVKGGNESFDKTMKMVLVK